MLANTPEQWTEELGSDADYAVIADTSDETNGYANRTSLFPEITSVNVKYGGIPPHRTDLNGFIKLLGDNIFFYQRGGTFKYSIALDYSAGALVRSSDNELYYCLQDNGPDTTDGIQDLSNEEYWLCLTTVEITYATTDEYGVVILTNDYTTADQDKAATAYAVKQCYDDLSTAISELETDITSQITELSESITNADTSFSKIATYDEDTTYYIGNLVVYGVDLYYCTNDNGPLTDNGVHDPSDEEYWTCISNEAVSYATTESPGIVQLSSEYTSSDETSAATSLAVYTAYSKCMSQIESFYDTMYETIDEEMSDFIGIFTFDDSFLNNTDDDDEEEEEEGLELYSMEFDLYNRKLWCFTGVLAPGTSGIDDSYFVPGVVSSFWTELIDIDNPPIKKTGARGSLAGYETATVISGTSYDLYPTSPDTMVWSTSGACTLTIYAHTDPLVCGVKVLYLTAAANTAITITGATYMASTVENLVWGDAGDTLILVFNYINSHAYMSINYNSHE